MRLILGLLISICLTACGGSGSNAVNTPAPIISTFASDAETIILGDSATLTTAFTNGSASIDNGVGSVFSDFVVVTPSATTTYTLTVTNVAGTRVTQSLEVIVKPFLTGYFTDSAVEGLNYATETQSGITNNLGAFTYLEGETISFTIGTFVLGDTVAAKAAMTPLDLTAPSLSLPTTNGELKFLASRLSFRWARPFGKGINFSKFQNLLIFLQALDSDKDADNGITIPEGMSVLLKGVELDFEAYPTFFRQAFAFRKVMAEAVTDSLITDGFIKTSDYALLHYYEQQGINTSFTQVGGKSIDNNGDSVPDDITTYTYDADGNMLTESDDNDADGLPDDITTYTYDANGNRLTSRQLNGDGVMQSIYTVTYDANGNSLTAVLDEELTGKKSYTRTYDANGNQLTFSEDRDADGLPDDITTYTYDAGGNMLTVSYEYGAVSLASGSENSIAKATYDANGNRLTESYDDNGNGTIDSIITNTYDANGNPLIIRSDNDANGTANFVTTSTYDANGNQLTNSYDDNGNGTVDSISTWTYDASGNLLTYSFDDNGDGLPNQFSTWTYDAYGNMLTYSPDDNGDGTIDSIITNTYDANGNKLTFSDDRDADGVAEEFTTYTRISAMVTTLLN
jgi:hypothetical protein